MKKFYAVQRGDSFVFEGEELAHFNVLRCKLGEQILCLGNGDYDYICSVTQIDKKHAFAKIDSNVLNDKNPKINITCFMGLVKGEKADLITQKLTELGASGLYFFESEFVVAKGNNNKIERLNKISKEACKQCGRNIPLKVYDCIKFDEMLSLIKNYDIVLFANEKDVKIEVPKLKSAKNIAMIVGSEGGFSDTEVKKINEMGAISFGLGNRILRAETACIDAVGIVSYLTGN